METLTVAKPKLEKLKGKNIIGVWTIGSWYANGYLKIHYRKGNEPMREARIHVNTLLPILQKYDFEMNPSRVYTHLENPKQTRK